jgi:hypothetical protein
MPDLFTSPTKSEAGNQPAKQPATESHAHKDLSFFHAYCYMPTNVTFANQETNEQVVLLLRQHFITNLSWITFAIVLSLLPWLLLLILPLANISLTVIPLTFQVIFISFYYLIIIGYAFIQFVTWFYNVGIITPRRIIDIDFTDIMSRNIAETRMNDVIDTEFNQGGFLHSFYDYGNVFIQTEGMKPNFEFLSVPHPGKVVDVILDLKEQAEHE